MICFVKMGFTTFYAHTLRNITAGHCTIRINDTYEPATSHGTDTAHDTITTNVMLFLKRGDFVQCKGGWYPK